MGHPGDTDDDGISDGVDDRSLPDADRSGDIYGELGFATLTVYRHTLAGFLPDVVRKPEAGDFSATAWEARHSSILKDYGFGSIGYWNDWYLLSPIVNVNNRVIAHVGWLRGNSIYVPSKAALDWGRSDDVKRLNNFIDNGGVVYGGSNGFVEKIGAKFSTDDVQYQVLVRPDGRAMRFLGQQSVGLVSADDTLWTLIGIGQLVVLLGRLGRRAILSLVLRSEAKSAAGEPLSEMTADELEAVWGRGPAKPRGPRDARTVSPSSLNAPTATATPRYVPNPNDLDWRGTNRSFHDATQEAFRRTRVPIEQFRETKWVKTEYGKTVPVEWKGPDGAEVSIDVQHTLPAPDIPHVGWQGAGKGAPSGHIFVDRTPYGRAGNKGE